MAKSRGVDAKLSRLRALRQEPSVPEHLGELRKSLGDSSNVVVAAAAEIAGFRMAAELAPDLLAAFDRFLIDPVETDKLCRAKIAIVEALNKLEYEKADVFLRGIRHIQKEPRWPKEEDSAARLRANAAFGLLRINHHDLLILLAELLTDEEAVARMASAQALGESRAPAAIPLLRFKILTGDKDDEVTAECLKALMIAAPDESLPFVSKFLDSDNEAIQAGAAFALAESRRLDALEVLVKYWPNVRSASLQEVVLVAISTTRLNAGVDFLLTVLESATTPVALAALSALAIHSHNRSVRERIAAIVSKKGDGALQERFAKKFALKE